MHDRDHIPELIARHRACFASGRTRDPAFRIDQLKRLRLALKKHEPALLEALRQDLGKPAFEAYGGDVAIAVNEVDHLLRHVRAWARPRRVRTPLVHLPARCFVAPEPYGVALIIGPWNFPVQLVLAPLAAALAAGNCAVLKPSEAAPRTAGMIAAIIRDHLDRDAVSVVEGGADTAQELLRERFDYLFFTGGPAVGKLVMEAAARHLTPLTLELGGKNPCIVDADVDLDTAARRIVWGKFYNAGQSCVAVDYLLVDRRVKDALLARILSVIHRFYGADPAASPDYARIVNDRHVDRLARLLNAGTVVTGGVIDRAARYVDPTVIDDVRPDDAVMQEEVFGPVLPVLAFDALDEALAFVNRRPRPLALYVFSRDRTFQRRVLDNTSSGGACVNETVIQFTIGNLPFGGIGDSGMGAYHGKAGFDAFSHQRSIVKNGFLIDIFLRYPPYRNHLAWLRKFF